MIDAHRGAFEYDWRTRFHLPLTAVGKSMTWGEAYRLTQALSTDPASAVAASLADWEHPVSRESLILMDVFDSSEASRAGRKAKRYPRPYGDKTKRRIGRARMSRQELRDLLDAHRATTQLDEKGVSRV